MAGYVLVLFFRVSLFCDMCGLGAGAGAGAFSPLVVGDAVSALPLAAAIDCTAMDGSDDCLEGSGGGVGILVV